MKYDIQSLITRHVVLPISLITSLVKSPPLTRRPNFPVWVNRLSLLTRMALYPNAAL